MTAASDRAVADSGAVESLGPCGCRRWPTTGESSARCAEHTQPGAPYAVGEQVRIVTCRSWCSQSQRGEVGRVIGIDHFPGYRNEWLLDVVLPARGTRPLFPDEITAALP